MSISEKKVMIGLYLKGHDVDPQKISRSLGVVASRSHRRGETQTTSSGRKLTTKTGFWSWVIDRDPGEISDALAVLFATFGQGGALLERLPDVQEAYFDVFVAIDSDSDGDGAFFMELSECQLKALSSYNLPIRFTVNMGSPN
jgi:hypothetical protein